MEPCGTPHCTLYVIDLVSLYCADSLVLLKQLLNHPKVFPHTPNHSSLFSNIIFVLNVSKALERSRNMLIVIVK